MAKHKYRNKKANKPVKEIVYLKTVRQTIEAEPVLIEDTIEEKEYQGVIVTKRERLTAIIITFSVISALTVFPFIMAFTEKGLEGLLSLLAVAGGIILALGLLILPIKIEEYKLKHKPVKKRKFKAINYSR